MASATPMSGGGSAPEVKNEPKDGAQVKVEPSGIQKLIQEKAAAQAQTSYKQPARRRGNVVRPSQLTGTLDALKSRIEVDRYDVEAWETLLGQLKPPSGAGRQADIRGRASSDTLRQVYGDFLEVFPTSSAGWRGILELESSEGEQQRVNEGFGQSLLRIKSLDLWRVYIKHVRATNRSDTPDGSNAIKQAYEFTLDHLGTDINSGPLWMEYLFFLQNSNAGVLFGESAAGNEESAKLVAIRRAFQRAVTIPTHSLEALWREYDKFENGVNRQLAKQIINDLQGQYSTSRTIYRELKKKWEGIKGGALATPPGKSHGQYKQQKLWTSLIAFERSNPLKLEKESLGVRVELVYNQCLLCLYHFPEIWYEYATWHASTGDKERASEVFKRAIEALPSCTILSFAAADFEAAQDKIEEAKKIYEDLLVRVADLEPQTQGQVWIQYMRFLRRTEGASSSRKLFLRARKSEGHSHHIYSTSALLEWQNGKDMKVAKNIFELGLKSFLKETEYVLDYAGFLVSQGDISNARILYERALTVAQGEGARTIWNEFLKFEYQCGDLQSTLALEKRRKEALEELDDVDPDELLKRPGYSIGLLLLRYSVNGMLPCSEKTLGHLQAVKVDEAFYGLPKLASEPESPRTEQPREVIKTEGGQPSNTLPSALSNLLDKLPPRNRLNGPLPSAAEVDSVLQVISSLDFKLLREEEGIPSGGGGASKRKREGVREDRVRDVYRMRQMERARRGR